MARTTTSTLRRGVFAGVAAALAAASFVAPAPAAAQETELTARVWLDHGEDPVLNRGERVRLYYRTGADAFVAIFHIDTNGTTRLLFPRSPEENHYVRANRDYRLLFPESTWWYVQDDPGIGYFFIVASPEPFDFRDFRYSSYQGGWDLSYASGQVHTDPYVAMDEYVARLIPDWEYVPYALDFASYHVDQRYDYPRFLCYDCHGFRPYSVWNPYYYSCASFRVVIYDDPYYYPAYRYRGDRVVYVRPPSRGLPRFEFKERARGEAGAPLVTSRPAVADRPGVPGSAAPRRSTSDIGSGGRAAPSQLDRGLPSRPAPGRPSAGESSLPDRPSDVLPGRDGRPVVGAPARGSVRSREGDEPGRVVAPPAIDPDRSRPVLLRRPTTRSGGESGSTPTGGQARPTTRGGGGSAAPTVRPPTGGARPTARPQVRKPGGGGSAPARPTSQPQVRKPGGGGSAPARPVARPSGGGAGESARPAPQVRRPGGGGSSPAQVRSSSGSSRGQVRSSGGSPRATAPAPRRPGGGTSAARPRRPGGGAAPNVA
jgi:hypothetical protein